MNKINYNLYYTNRQIGQEKKRGGGVGICVRKEIISRRVDRIGTDYMVWVEIDTGKGKIVIGGVYITPIPSRKKKDQHIVEDIVRETNIVIGKYLSY